MRTYERWHFLFPQFCIHNTAIIIHDVVSRLHPVNFTQININPSASTATTEKIKANEIVKPYYFMELLYSRNLVFTTVTNERENLLWIICWW